MFKTYEELEKELKNANEKLQSREVAFEISVKNVKDLKKQLDTYKQYEQMKEDFKPISMAYKALTESFIEEGIEESEAKTFAMQLLVAVTSATCNKETLHFRDLSDLRRLL